MTLMVLRLSKTFSCIINIVDLQIYTGVVTSESASQAQG